jgi:integrase
MHMAIHKRGPIWWIQYFVHGLPMRESSGSGVKVDAENLLKQRLGEVATGRWVGPDNATIADLCELVLADYRLRKLSDEKHAQWRYESNVKPLIGCLLAARFGTAQVRQYIERRRQDGASNGTINRELAIVRRGFRLGAQEDPPLVHRQPAIPKLKEADARHGFIEPEVYEKLLEEMPANLRALFVCCYHTGTRKNELRRIKWDQVDFDAMVIRLHADQTKGKVARTLPIYGDMKRWLLRQQETAGGNPYVFHGKRGFPVDNHLLGWAEACERVGLPGLYLHDMRRSAIRNLKRAGVQDVVAMKISGHKTRSVFDRYNIVDEGDLGDAGESLEKYFSERKAERAAKLKRVK